MIVKAFKTHKIRVGDSLFKILDKYLPKLKEKDIVVITSKIIAICEGRLIKNDGKFTKQQLAQKEAQYFLPDKFIKYGVKLTITKNILIASAGIDESNSNGYFVLWPKNPMKNAKEIWVYIKEKFKLQSLGVLISDSHGMISRKGLTGFGLSWCGFEPLKDYIGKKDIFGKTMMVSKTNLVDSLASFAVLVMGEGNEQTPLSVIQAVPFIKFVNHPPTKSEINEITIPIKDDIYSALLTSVKWERGEGK